jgi:2,4-dienoyl-CoA reductase-like NADH-dependent reductase (Old Yellow Enzyme family)
MTLVHTRERVLAMADMVGAVKRAGSAIVLQVGHGGLYSMEAWHEPYATRRKGPLLTASPPRWWMKPVFARVPVHAMSTDEVHGFARHYGDVAAWTREAGYDGIQLGSANAKLLDQFLSPFYNRRTDEFGGSTERRAHILRVIREAIAQRAGADFPTLVKVPSEQAPPFAPHVTDDEALRTCELACEWGFDAITPVRVSVFPDTTLSRGDVPSSIWENTAMRNRFRTASPSRLRRTMMTAAMWVGGKRSPFVPVWNRDLFRAARQRVSVPVFAVGGIRTAAEARQIVEDEEADMVGFGRPFYAQDDLAAHVLADGHARCQSSNKCVPAQMLGMKGVCYNPAVTRRSQ